MAERARGKSQACWWPDGRAELLSLDGRKDLRAMFGRGDSIPGAWSRGSSGASGAAVWRLSDGPLVGADLHDGRFDKTWAECAGHGRVLGVGVHKGRMGARPKDSGLVWFADGTRHEITAAGDVCLKGTDGVRVIGSVGGRAALWADESASPVDLGPAGFYSSEVNAIDGDVQVGVVFKGLGSRAGLWRGTAESFVDLTPSDYEVARAFHAAGAGRLAWYGAGVTQNGSSSLAAPLRSAHRPS